MATSLKEFSTTAGSNTLVGTANVAEGCAPSGINNAIRQIIAYIIDFFMNTDTISSATTTDLGTKTTNYLTVTGTTTITALGTPTNKTEYTVTFAGILTLTHNATSLILPGGANIITAAGDVAKFKHEGSGNWRCVSYTPASGIGALGGTTATDDYVLTANGSGVAPTWQPQQGGGYAAKAAGYTVIATDNRDVIDFTTAGVTATLTAAATLGAGFTVTIANTAASGDVTINPDGSETLDGLATRLLRPGDRVEIVTDGSNWKTLRGTYSYDSGAQTITAGGALSLAHGLGMQPELQDIRCELINVTDQHGFTTGQYLPTPLGGFTNGASNQWSFQPDATDLNLRYGSSSAVNIPVRSTGTLANITLASWTLRVKVSVRYG
jgi:hypothetical protein